MATKSVTKNYIYNLMYQVLVLILPLITAPYISRVLGAENIGIYSFTLSISAYFILFGSLGIALYGQREIAYVQDNKKKYSVIFWEILLLRIMTMGISLLIYYFTFVKGENYQIYYKVLMLEIIGNCIDISWFFQGLEEFKKTVTRNMIVKLISVFCIFAFVKSSNDLYTYFLIYVLSILIGNITLWFYLPKYLTKVSINEFHLFRHLKSTITLFIPQIAIQVYTLLDRTMVGAIVPEKSEVGFYDQGQKIIKILLAIITSMGTVMLPRIANNFASGEKEKITNYLKKSFNMVFLLGFPMIFGIIAVSKSFVPVFFGQGYDKVSVLMSIISPIIVLIGLSNVTGTQYLLPTKRQKEYTISVVCGAIVNFIMNICLIWNWGAIGASIGTVIAELTVTLVQIYFVREDFDFKEIFKLSRKYLVSSIIITFVPYTIIWINNNYLNLFIILLIQFILLYAFFKIKRFKNGFNFLYEKLSNDFSDIIVINVSIAIILIACLLGTIFEGIEQIRRNLLATFIALGIIMIVIINKTLTMYYKQNLLERTLQESQKEIKEREEEVKALNNERFNISKITHEFYNRQKAMELLVKQNINTNSDMKEYDTNKNILKIIKSLTEEYTEEFNAIKSLSKLEKTDIYEIDNMFKYMQSECEKNNIEFKLKIIGNIYPLINNIIPENKLETLIGDHLRDAINAVNSANTEKREIFAILGIKNNIYELCIYDTGINFEIETLMELGLEPVTAYANKGGSGIGFITTFETLKQTKASLIITEQLQNKKNYYTKSVAIRFDNKNEYRICSYRAEQIEKYINKRQILIEKT